MLIYQKIYKMFILKVRISTFNTKDNSKEKIDNVKNSFNIKIKNTDQNNNEAGTFEKFNKIKITKLEIFDEQRTRLKD